ncbi:MAG: hypothetical protein K5931_07100, partial [Lachnospiraceae bacterium]|nr:hypothetical protein [Lachnospiraceae bacterium]
MRDKKLLCKNILTSLVLIAGVGLVLFYIFFKERTEYHVDVTDTLLWGAAMLDGGSIYNPDFWYAYNIPFSGAILMIPFVKAFGITYLTQMLGMAAFAMVFVIALYFCLRALSFEHFQCAAVTGLLMIFLCASKVTRMIFFCHVIHYSL